MSRQARKGSTTKPDIYQVITDKMIELLEAGTVPWRKPWNTRTGRPMNLDSRPYRGINVLLLGLAPHNTPYWLTFKQARERGGSVIKGEKGTLIVFWKRLRVTDKDTGDPKVIPLLRYYYVFNLAQTEGVKVPKKVEEHLAAIEAGKEVHEHEPLAAAEDIVTGYIDGPTIRTIDADRAFYTPDLDVITVPPLTAYDEAEEFYSTLFHEIGHSTGHVGRLDRFTGKKQTFGCKDYGREELVAEMTAAFLCAEADIVSTWENSAAYLRTWIKTIREDTKIVIVAAAQAQRAADLVLGHTFEPSPDEDESTSTEPEAVLV